MLLNQLIFLLCRFSLDLPLFDLGPSSKGCGSNLQLSSNEIAIFHWTLDLGSSSKVALKVTAPAQMYLVVSDLDNPKYEDHQGINAHESAASNLNIAQIGKIRLVKNFFIYFSFEHRSTCYMTSHPSLQSYC